MSLLINYMFDRVVTEIFFLIIHYLATSDWVGMH